eukprot:c2965_g1_i2.p3 GENE.c2965_g1_i2~~c2965_g1_i2.p3  ORF type:complete len:126 (+),score=1.40 c2965_g1_i2:270-647(+)
MLRTPRTLSLIARCAVASGPSAPDAAVPSTTFSSSARTDALMRPIVADLLRSCTCARSPDGERERRESRRAIATCGSTRPTRCCSQLTAIRLACDRKCDDGAYEPSLAWQAAVPAEFGQGLGLTM